MGERVILDNERYRVIHKRCPFEEGDPREFDYDTPDDQIEDRFDLCDLVVDLIQVTKPYSQWHSWIECLAGILTLRQQELLAEYEAIVNRPGPFEPGGALYEDVQKQT